MNDLYSILEVDSNSSSDTIKKSFKRLSLIYHPDKNNSYEAHERFIEIRNAYDILINEDKRKIYDYQRRFSFLQDYEITEEEMNIITNIYEKIINSDEIKFFTILYNTLPETAKQNIKKFNENLFKEKKEIVLSHKYINIEKLNEDFILNLNINIFDVYNNSLKIIILHTKSGIYYLYLRYFEKNLIFINDTKKFKIIFNIIDNNDFIKKDKDLIIIKKINIYELLFVHNFSIFLPNKESINIERKNNINFFKNQGFQIDYHSKRGNLLILFHLDYKKNYSKYENSIKEIFN